MIKSCYICKRSVEVKDSEANDPNCAMVWCDQCYIPEAVEASKKTHAYIAVGTLVFENDFEEDVFCDGCGLWLGIKDNNPARKNELHLCSDCTPANCSWKRLVEVGGYDNEVTKQKAEWVQLGLPLD